MRYVDGGTGKVGGGGKGILCSGQAGGKALEEEESGGDKERSDDPHREGRPALTTESRRGCSGTGERGVRLRYRLWGTETIAVAFLDTERRRAMRRAETFRLCLAGPDAGSGRRIKRATQSSGWVRRGRVGWCFGPLGSSTNQ